MKQQVLSHPWVRRKTHISWFIAATSAGVLIGIVLAPYSNDTYTSISWAVIAAALFLCAVIRRWRYLLLLALVAGVLLGLWRGSAQQQKLASYQPLYGKQLTITGRVVEDTSFGSRGDQRMRIGDVQILGRQFSGVLWVSTDSKSDIKRGDVVQLRGKLEAGFGNIPASMFRAKVTQNTRPVPGDLGRQTRDWFAVGVYRSVPPVEADLALAFLVGQKLTISDTLNDQLRTVGLIHAVVASGYHLTILMIASRRLFVKRSKYLTALASALLIIGFIMITGFSPSMTRAGLVAGLSLAAWYYGRVIHPLVLLPFAAALTVLYQPAYLWGDVGWYLSFAAFSGVILIAPLLQDYFWGKQKRPGLLHEVVVATIAAQIATLPIIIYVFGYYSAYAVLSNLLVVPLIPFTMLLTFIAGIVGLIAPVFAPIFGAPVVWLLNYMMFVVEKIASIPGVKTEVTFSPLAVLISYLIIIALTVGLWRVTRHNFRRDTSSRTQF